MALRQIFQQKQVLNVIVRSFSQTASSGPSGSAPKPPPVQSRPEDKATGLTPKCVHPANGPVGPGAKSDGEYKVPEYFCYDKTSYFEAEIEMAQFRCPQPDANRN